MRNILVVVRHYRLPAGTIWAAVALAMVGLGHGSANPLGATIGLVGASLCVFVLPGYFVVDQLTSAQNAPAPERWMLSSGFSLLIVACLCTFALTTHIPIRFVAAALPAAVAASGAMEAIRVRPARKPVDSSPCFLRWAAIAAWSFCVAVAYFVGHADVAAPLVENLQAIAIVDALRSALSPEQAYYIHDVPPVYPFPAIHYGYALVASIADTSALFVFDKMRLIWTATALSALFTGVRALSRRVDYAYFALFGGSILVLAGPQAAVSVFYWGQLAATSHWADVAMNVIAPIALASLLLWLSPDGRSRPHLLILFSCMGIVLAEVHQRELVEILVFLAGAIVVVVLNRDRRSAFLLIAAATLPVAAAGLYLKWATLSGPGIAALAADWRQMLLSDFIHLDWITAFQVYSKRVLLYEFSMLYGLNGLMLLIAVVVMFLCRDGLAVRTVGLAIAAFLLAESFAVISIPVLYATYDELLFTPICRIIFPLYCLFWIGIAMIAEMTAALAQKLRQQMQIVGMIPLGIAASLALAATAHVLGGPNHPEPVDAHLSVLAKSLAILCAVSGLTVAFWPHRSEPGAGRKPTLVFAAGLAVLLPLAAIEYSSTSFLGVLKRRDGSASPTGVITLVYQHYLAAYPASPTQCIDETTDVLGYKVPDSFCMPPLSVIQSVNRRGLPSSSVLLVDPLGSFSPMGFLPVQLAGPMVRGIADDYRNWSVAFPKFRDVVARALEVHNGMPFFSPDEDADERFTDARSLGATHVLASPPERERIMAAIGARPDLFKLLLDESGWVLLEIVPRTGPQSTG